jgi:hypothetical protein
LKVVVNWLTEWLEKIINCLLSSWYGSFMLDLSLLDMLGVNFFVWVFNCDLRDHSRHYWSDRVLPFFMR